MKRIERLTAIITFLQTRKFSSVEKLQEKFGVSERTIYRDLNSLHEIGVPVSYEKGYGYFILDTYFIPPISFSENEAIALSLAGTLMKRFSDDKTNEHFQNAFDKVKYALNYTQKDTLEAIEANIKTPEYKEEYRKKHLFTVQCAITNRHILNIKYKNRKGELSDREIEPIGITFYGNEWHTIAYCRKRNEYRDFRIAAIFEIKNSMSPFRKENHLSLEEYIQNLKKI